MGDTNTEGVLDIDSTGGNKTENIRISERHSAFAGSSHAEPAAFV